MNITEVTAQPAATTVSSEDISPDTMLTVYGKDTKIPQLEEVAVTTSNKSILKCFGEMTLDEAKHVFVATWMSMVNTLEKATVDEMYEEKGEAWQNLCDDIVLFYVARSIVFKNPIPIKDPSSKTDAGEEGENNHSISEQDEQPKQLEVPTLSG
jgi:hypothetical protein